MLNVSCPQAQLHSRIQTVAHGVSGRSTQPVQNNIYLEAAGGKLRLVATDLEFISLEATIDADVADEGAVTVPARLITEVMGAAAGEEISLEADERNTLAVSSASSRWEIRGMSAADFEMLPELVDATELELPQSALHGILSQTVFATSQDETRPILTGALFKIEPGGIETVATDTYRLALRRLTAEIPIEEPRSAIISARALVEVLRVLFQMWEEVGGPTERYLPYHVSSWYHLRFASYVPFYYILLAMLLIALFLNVRISRSKLGYYLFALGENEDAAEVLGVDARACKLRALMIYAFLVGAAGGVYACLYGFIHPNFFSSAMSTETAILGIVGGMGITYGPLVAAVLLVSFREFLRASLGGQLEGLYLAVYAVILILIALFRPQGIATFIRDAYGKAMSRLSVTGEKDVVSADSPGL